MAINQIAIRNNEGNFENLFPLTIDKGGTGQNTIEATIAQMCGIGFGASNKVTDCLAIDTINPYAFSNLPSIIGTENAATLVNSPVQSGAFYAQRTIYPIQSEHSGYHFIVYLHEMYPKIGRIWAAGYNKDIQSWGDGWHLITSQSIYEIGAVYISYNSTSPATLFGGSWVAITGRFPYFNAGTSTGGSNTHTLSINEIPNHNHSLRYDRYTMNGGSSDGVPYASIGQTIGYNGNACGTTGGGAAHNNMPAYQTFYAWRRTA